MVEGSGRSPSAVQPDPQNLPSEAAMLSWEWFSIMPFRNKAPAMMFALSTVTCLEPFGIAETASGGMESR